MSVDFSFEIEQKRLSTQSIAGDFRPTDFTLLERGDIRVDHSITILGIN
jgi:hypothetical protein